MNFKYRRFVALGLLLLAIAGCSSAKGGSGNNRDLITQDEIEQNKKAATQKRPGAPAQMPQKP